MKEKRKEDRRKIDRRFETQYRDAMFKFNMHTLLERQVKENHERTCQMLYDELINRPDTFINYLEWLFKDCDKLGTPKWVKSMKRIAKHLPVQYDHTKTDPHIQQLAKDFAHGTNKSIEMLEQE